MPRGKLRGGADRGESMKRRHLQIILAAVLFLLALGLTLYPVVSNYYNRRHQSQIQTAYRG